MTSVAKSGQATRATFSASEHTTGILYICTVYGRQSAVECICSCLLATVDCRQRSRIGYRLLPSRQHQSSGRETVIACSSRYRLQPSNRVLALLTLLVGTAACAPLDEAAILRLGNLEKQLAAVEESLAAGTETGAETQASVNALRDTVTADQAGEAERLARIERQLNSLPTAVAKRCAASEASTSTQCPPARSVVSSDDKLLLGEVEWLRLDPPGVDISARIDTGASSSSLHATNIASFERDGEDWVRFELEQDGKTTTVERAVVKTVRVVQQADREGQLRPVVQLQVRLGSINDSVEFTLADRSHLENAVILGRNFLTDLAVVDVGRQYVQPRIDS